MPPSAMNRLEIWRVNPPLPPTGRLFHQPARKQGRGTLAEAPLNPHIIATRTPAACHGSILDMQKNCHASLDPPRVDGWGGAYPAPVRPQ